MPLDTITREKGENGKIGVTLLDWVSLDYYISPCFLCVMPVQLTVLKIEILAPVFVVCKGTKSEISGNCD